MEDEDQKQFLIMVRDMLDLMEPDLRVHHLRSVIQRMMKELEE
tara:strand:- start:374 stop:502 length:129 start_codon:yes stop_codon:yes gene_type:complete